MIKIRASSLTNWLDCQRRAAAQIFRQEIEDAGYMLNAARQNIGAAVGSGVHAGSMYMAANKMSGTYEKSEKKYSEEKAVFAYDEQSENGVMFDYVTPDRNTAIKQMLRQLDSFNSFILPMVNPSSVETRIEAKYNDNVILSGQPDIIAVTTVRDLKAGKFSGYHGAQVGAYSLLARANGDDINEIIIDHVPRVDMRKPQPVPTSTKYETSLCEKLAVSVISDIENRYEQFMKSGDIEAFFPNPSSILCGDKFCQAFGTKTCKHCKVK